MKFGAGIFEGIKALVSAVPIVGPVISTLMGGTQAQQAANKQKAIEEQQDGMQQQQQQMAGTQNQTQNQVNDLSEQLKALVEKVNGKEVGQNQQQDGKIRPQYETIPGQSAAPQYSDKNGVTKSLNKSPNHIPSYLPVNSVSSLDANTLQAAGAAFKGKEFQAKPPSDMKFTGNLKPPAPVAAQNPVNKIPVGAGRG